MALAVAEPGDVEKDDRRGADLQFLAPALPRRETLFQRPVARQTIGDDRDTTGIHPHLYEAKAPPVRVGQDTADLAKRPSVERRQRLPGAHGSDHGDFRKAMLDKAGIAIGGPPHAEDDLGPMPAQRPKQTGRQKVQAGVERLQREMRDAGTPELLRQQTARPKGQHRDVVTLSVKLAGQMNALTLRSATAQIILKNENSQALPL